MSTPPGLEFKKKKKKGVRNGTESRCLKVYFLAPMYYFLLLLLKFSQVAYTSGSHDHLERALLRVDSEQTVDGQWDF